MNPKVSICIPAYKQVTILRKVLDSIRVQTFENYELIITDDSPGNDVELLLREFDFKGKLKYFRNNTPLGSPANWNYAISQAKGEYIKMVHSDDFFTSAQSLAKYVEMLDNNAKADFAFSAAESLNLSTNKIRIHSCSAKDFKKLRNEPVLLFFRNVIGPPSSTIYRRSINLQYDTNLKWMVDVDFYLRILNNNAALEYCAEPLICVTNSSEEQITLTVINDRQLQIREHVLLFDKLLKNTTGINEGKFLLFFKLLFNKFKVKSMDELTAIIPIQAEQIPFYKKVISSVNCGMVSTRILVRFYNSYLNKHILKMELF